MKMKVLELGGMVKDIITQELGMLTHLIINIGGNKEYIFQPKGLNPETGQPVDRIWVTEERIFGGKFIHLNLPTEILGTKAQDLATSFKGRIVTMTYHINGCLHVEIKPVGKLKNTGATIAPCDFDIRRVKGEKIKPLTGRTLQESIDKTPSPMPIPRRVIS